MMFVADPPEPDKHWSPTDMLASALPGTNRAFNGTTKNRREMRRDKWGMASSIQLACKQDRPDSH
jgi:hypothetical protein